MVTHTETVMLLDQFLATRSPELREKLVLQSVPLVHYMLGRMGMTIEMGTDYEDLAHQGLMGLIEAVDHFDPKFNVLFSTYASLRIRGKVLDYLRSSDWMPRSARKRTRLIQKTVSVLCSEYQREPSEEEIASRMGISVDEIQQGLSDANRVLISLDLVMESDQEEDGSLYERLRDEKQVNPSELFEHESLVEALGEAIRNLSEREQLVLSLYYNDGLTFKEIGKVLDITESRVCQLHARAIFSLKGMMEHE